MASVANGAFQEVIPAPVQQRGQGQRGSVVIFQYSPASFAMTARILILHASKHKHWEVKLLKGTESLAELPFEFWSKDNMFFLP